MRSLCLLAMTATLLFSNCAFAELENKPNENERLYGKELSVKQFSDDKKKFTGKIVYEFPLLGWQIEALYVDGKSFSEAARPKGNKVKKTIITEKEASAIADILFPRKHRGPYKKQMTNANFVSHFFDKGVVSFEMQLDARRRNHIGIIGIRTVLYNNGQTFKTIKVNAYH